MRQVSHCPCMARRSLDGPG